MPASEFYEWMILELMEPFGDRRADIQAGIIASNVLNSSFHRDPKKLISAMDVIPDWDKQATGKSNRQTEYSPEQQRKIMRIFAVAHNAKVKMGRA